MKIHRYCNKENEYSNILNFFKEIDKYFYPPLSSRTSLKHFIGPIIKNGSILYLTDKNKIIGLITYYYYYPKYKSAYLDVIAISKKFRCKKLTSILMNKMFNDLKSKKIKKLKVRTWSTNLPSTNLYLKYGFKIYRTIKNARGKGVHSIYFKKQI